MLDNLLAGAYQMIPGSLLGTVFGLPGARAGERRARQVAGAVAELLDLADVGDELVGNARLRHASGGSRSAAA